MAQYYMGIKSNSTDYKWEPCRATTLAAAKAEATRALGASARDDEWLVVGLGPELVWDAEVGGEVEVGGYEILAFRRPRLGVWERGAPYLPVSRF